MWYRIIMVLLMVITIGYPRQQWRWANDSMEMTFDKEAHLAASFGLYYMFKYKGFSDRESILYTTTIGLTKETIDALFPWEKYGRIGGDGFSKNDLTEGLNLLIKRSLLMLTLCIHLLQILSLFKYSFKTDLLQSSHFANFVLSFILLFF